MDTKAFKIIIWLVFAIMFMFLGVQCFIIGIANYSALYLGYFAGAATITFGAAVLKVLIGSLFMWCSTLLFESTWDSIKIVSDTIDGVSPTVSEPHFGCARA